MLLKGIRSDKKDLKKLVIILIVIMYLIPTFTEQSLGIGNVAIFITIYIIGAYIRLEYNRNYKNRYLFIFILSILLIFGMQILCERLVKTKYINYFANLNNIMVLISSVSLFVYFKNINLQSNFVNLIASTTFGVYLIHSNYFVHRFIWGNLFNNSKYYISNDYKIIIHSIFSIALTYIVCVIIDLFRIYCIERWLLPILYKFGKYLIIKKEEICKHT